MAKKTSGEIFYPKFDLAQHRKECSDLGFESDNLILSVTGREESDKLSLEDSKNVTLVNKSKNVYINFFNEPDENFISKIFGFLRNILN